MFSVILVGSRIFLKYWKLFTALVVVCTITAGFIVNSLKIKYEATYIAAPYFETATDVTLKLRELTTAINDNNTAYISKNIGDSLDPTDFTNATIKKVEHRPDMSLKHVKLIVQVDVLNPDHLKEWDQAFKKQFHLANQIPGNYYRSREINKERMIAILQDRYDYKITNGNDSDHVLNIMKFFNEQENITINDSDMVDLLFAKYKIEYINSFKVNTVTTFESSYRQKKEQFSKPTIFLSISFLPLFIIIFLMTAYEEFKEE